MECLAIILIIFGVFEMNKNTNSTPRFLFANDWFRILFDIFIIGSLFFRLLQICSKLLKTKLKTEKLKGFEKVVFATFFVALMPDLFIWTRWFYFTNLYLFPLILFSIPPLFWAVELFRKTSKKIT